MRIDPRLDRGPDGILRDREERKEMKLILCGIGFIIAFSLAREISDRIDEKRDREEEEKKNQDQLFI